MGVKVCHVGAEMTEGKIPWAFPVSLHWPGLNYIQFNLL